MFGSITDLLNLLKSRLVSELAQPTVHDDDQRLLGAILLVHVAVADGRMLPEERARMRAFLAAAFALSDDETDVMIALADQRDRMGEDMQEVAGLLRRSLDIPGRVRLVEALWDVAGADGRLHDFEANAIWRITDLIGLPQEDRARLAERHGA